MRTSQLPVRNHSMRRRCERMAAVSLVGLSLVAAACGSSTKSSTASTTATTAQATTTASTAPGAAAPGSTVAKGSGPVSVLYAGSLVDILGKNIGPAFHSASGYTFNGFSGGSQEVASQIKGKVRRADVFVSAAPSADLQLEGAANGNWVSWYADFATSPLLIGYNPKSKFAHQLQTEPWYKVVGQPGFLLGRTDPATDPKGVLAVTALNRAATTDNEPALKALATSPSNVFPENTLVGRLQAGQLDAGFFYSVESTSAKIPTVAIPGPTLAAKYTVTVVNQAPDMAAANAFVTYLLGPTGSAALKAGGMDLTTPPTVSGTAPPALHSVLSGS